MNRDFDVLVVGGAMAGAGTAALLAATPATARLRIALVEPRPATAPAADAPLDLRVSALSRASQQLLELTGAWPAVAARAAAYQRMVVWEERSDPGGADALVFDAAELGEPDLGHIGENLSIQAALTARAEALGRRAAARGIRDARVDARRHPRRAWRRARIPGRARRRRRRRRFSRAPPGGNRHSRLGLRAARGRRASRAWKPHGETAWQRFLDTGPLALLPLADGRVSLVWSTLPEHAEELVHCAEAEFAERVTAASAAVLGRLTATTPRASFPLRLLHARRYVTDRVALVGDAAHTVHPLAGQGINLAFLDAAALVDVVGDALEAGDDPGEPARCAATSAGARPRRFPRSRCSTASSGSSSAAIPLQSRLRRGALGLAQSSGTIKRLLMQRALGIAGGVPASVRRPPS